MKSASNEFSLCVIVQGQLLSMFVQHAQQVIKDESASPTATGIQDLELPALLRHVFTDCTSCHARLHIACRGS